MLLTEIGTGKAMLVRRLVASDIVPLTFSTIFFSSGESSTRLLVNGGEIIGTSFRAERCVFFPIIKV